MEPMNQMNQVPGVGPIPGQERGGHKCRAGCWHTILGVIVLLVLIAGGFWWYFEYSPKEYKDTETGYRAPLQQVLTDDPAALEAELNATDLDGLGADLNALEAELKK